MAPRAPEARRVIITHARCLEHRPGPAHPESPERLQAVLEALSDETFRGVPRRDAPLATREQLARVHDAALMDSLFSLSPVDGLARIDADTVMSPASHEAALRAAGAGVAAVDAVLGGDAKRAFCAVRPPGHHATPSTAMGFCLYNSIAVAAMHALEAHGLQRVAIVDFDVHHGNGTQDAFVDEPRVLYVSSHQSPLYPGTGLSSFDHVLNVPLPPNAGSAEFRAAYESTVFPALEAFRPQLVMISAGFDAHRLDPLASLELDAADYAWVTRRLIEIAERHSDGRVVSMLEGGYSLTALRESTAAHCRELFAQSRDL